MWWLSVWIEVQIVCIWSSRCHCHPKTTSSLAALKSRLVLPFRYRLTQVDLEMRQLNWCSSCYCCCNTLPDNNQKKQLWTLSFLMPEERDIHDSTDAYNEYGRSAVKKLTTGSLTFSLSVWLCMTVSLWTVWLHQNWIQSNPLKWSRGTVSSYPFYYNLEASDIHLSGLCT